MTEIVTQERGYEWLPNTWEWARVEQVGDIVTGNTPSTKQQKYYGGSVPLFKPTDLNAGYWVAEANTTLTEEGAEKARVLPAKSILVTCIGATIGKTGLLQIEGATNQQINALVPSKGQVVSEYLFFAFTSSLLQDQILSNASSTTLPILNKSKFGQLRVPLPPLNEQRRIVEKIEELFTKLDAGVRSLEQARAQLKSYRRSVLKAAVEGELSREWREAHEDELEPASELLERILQERREKFAGTKYKKPASPNTSKLPALPNGWTYASPVQLASSEPHALGIGPFGSNLKVEDYRGDGVPLIFVRNIRSQSFGGDGTKYVTPDKAAQLQAHSARGGDILVTKMGDPPGDACLYPESRPTAIVTADCIKWRLSKLLTWKRLFVYFINSRPVHAQILRVTRGVAQLKISLGRFSEIAIPLPPLEEQSFIVEEVERRLSVVDKLEETVEASLKQARGLRQSILKQAFSGKLVPQDPDDEPASTVLARIREDREAAKQRAGRVRRGRTGPEKRVTADQGGLF